MIIRGLTDVGKMRRENQDTFCAIKFSQTEAFAVVCDGMGGANGGAYAANLASEVFKDYFLEMQEKCQIGGEKAFMFRAIEQANAKVFAEASHKEKFAGMGTTAVCLMIRDDAGFIAHVGDSRCYVLRDKKLTQLTKDHSYVQGLIDLGNITAKEALTHPKRSAITRAVGVDYHVEADFTSLTVVKDDILLLCSDGLTRVVSPKLIEKVFQVYDFKDTAKELVKLANAGGGPDNITVVVIKIESQEGDNG